VDFSRLWNCQLPGRRCIEDEPFAASVLVQLEANELPANRLLRRFLGWGLARARGEVGLLVLAHNPVTVLAEELIPFFGAVRSLRSRLKE
jgi:hypothetical protein